MTAADIKFLRSKQKKYREYIKKLKAVKAQIKKTTEVVFSNGIKRKIVCSEL